MSIKKIQAISDLNLSTDMLREFILKLIYVNGSMKGADMARDMRVSFNLVEEELVFLKKRELIGLVGAGSGLGGYSSMEFDLTPQGRARAREIASVRPYVGALPVTIEDYTRVFAGQTLNARAVQSEMLDHVFKDMILNPSYYTKIGPAINSGGPILFYGKPGNGKTMIAEKIIQAFDDEIYVPYCIMIDGQFIKCLDEKVHHVVSYDTPDPRWVKIKRPFIVVGGELTIEMLDLIYKDEFKYYEAPPQLKANGGVMLIDDFGRQMVSPRDLLNRWIYPLEKKFDYLTLVTGKKVEVPFSQMLIFSSNLTPEDLGDDAFLRRIKYKIEIEGPTREEFQELFKMQCEKIGIRYSDEAFKYLCNKHFVAKKREFRSCHARDLLNHVNDYNRFNKIKNELTKVNINFACDSYFYA